MISFDVSPNLEIELEICMLHNCYCQKNAMVHKGDLVSSVFLMYPPIIGQYNLWSWKWPTIELHTL